MKALFLATSLALVPAVTHAQSEDDPALRMFSRFLEYLIPDHADILKKLGSPDQYEMPEILPNGDILIRRKPPQMPPPKEGEIDL